MNSLFVATFLGLAALSCGQLTNPLENVDDINPFEARAPVAISRPTNGMPRQANRIRTNMAARRVNRFQRQQNQWMAQPNFGMAGVQPEEAAQGGNNAGAGTIVPEEAKVAPRANNRFPSRMAQNPPAAWQMG